MENKTIARTLRLLSQLMELHEENPFKIKSVANAYFKVDKLPFALKDKPIDEIDQVDGIGKSLAAKIIELLATGELQELNTILQQTPEGVVEMLGIKGIGPKKILIIWRTLGIETIGELYYACNENRLIEAKGFGLKTQEEIKNAIEFKLAANGRFLFAQVEAFAKNLQAQISEWLINVDNHSLLGVAGQFRRSCEIIDELEFVIGAEHVEEVQKNLESFEPLSLIAGEDAFITTTETGLRIKIFVVDKT
ncbi:MAG: DNA polymerase/3'-5' exonuclease PolX, partial [Chryseobacterium sp.]